MSKLTINTCYRKYGYYKNNKFHSVFFVKNKKHYQVNISCTGEIFRFTIIDYHFCFHNVKGILYAYNKLNSKKKNLISLDLLSSTTNMKIHLNVYPRKQNFFKIIKTQSKELLKKEVIKYINNNINTFTDKISIYALLVELL